MMKRERKYRAVGRVIGRFSGHPCLRKNADGTPDILGERENFLVLKRCLRPRHQSQKMTSL